MDRTSIPVADHYNLYKSLELDRTASTEQLSTELNRRLAELHTSGAPEYSGPYQEAYTALQILGNEQRRAKYDALLADDSSTITISTLRELANHPVKDQSPAAHGGFTASAAPAAAVPPAAPAAPVTPTSAAAAAQYQQQWSSQVRQASVIATVPTEVAPLPKYATISMMWERLPRMPKITAGLLAASFALNFITVLWAGFEGIVYSSALSGSDSTLADVIGSYASDFAAAFALLSIPSVFVVSLIVGLFSLYWLRATLLGSDNTAAIFLPASSLITGIAALISVFVVANTYSVLLNGLSGIVILTVFGLSFTKDVRAWFRGQALVRITQLAPGVPATQFVLPQGAQVGQAVQSAQGVVGYAPQNGQVDQANSYDPSSAFGLSSHNSQPAQQGQQGQNGQQSPNGQTDQNERRSEDGPSEQNERRSEDGPSEQNGHES